MKGIENRISFTENEFFVMLIFILVIFKVLMNYISTKINFNLCFIICKTKGCVTSFRYPLFTMVQVPFYKHARGQDGRLYEALKSNTVLTSLNLSTCGLQEHHATQIGEALLDNSALVTLNLSGNSICDAGLEQALKAIIYV